MSSEILSSVKPRDFDYTMMSCYQTCQRRYWFRHVRGLVPKAIPRPLSFGKAIHSALDIWYTTKSQEEAIKVFHATYKEDLSIDDKRTNAMGEWMLQNYFTQYQDQPWKLVHSEMAFTLPLPNHNNLIGRIDKIVDWQGTLWVVDHKTTSQLGAQYFKGIEPSLQFPGYVWAARQLGYKAVGMIVDALLVAKGLLQSATRARLTPCARGDSYMSEAKLDEWLETVLDIHGEIAMSEHTKCWIPSFDSCTYYGECPYRRVCIEEKELWERILSSEYKVEFWDPRKED